MYNGASRILGIFFRDGSTLTGSTNYISRWHSNAIQRRLHGFRNAVAFSTCPAVLQHQEAIEHNSLSPKRLPIPVFKYSQDQDRLSKLSSSGDQKVADTTNRKLLEVGVAAEVLLGTNRFSTTSTLKDVVGNYYDIISLFTLRNANENHPLFFLSRILEAMENYQRGVTNVNPYPLWRQMMTLLATEMFGPSEKLKQVGPEIQKIAHDRHARLSKIVEMAFVTQQIHRRILDSDSFPKAFSSTGNRISCTNTTANEINNANKTATLVGDLLWSQICVNMAALNCQAVSEMICEFLMDYCEGEFQYKPKIVASLHEQSSAETWFQRTQFGLGSIMGTTISAMLGFNGHEDHIRNSGYQLGMLLALSYQAHDDITFFDKDMLDAPNWLDMGLLPIVHKLQEESQLLKQDPSQIFEKLKSDEKIRSKCYRTLRILQEDTLSHIKSMEPYISCVRSRQILEQFVLSLHS